MDMTEFDEEAMRKLLKEFCKSYSIPCTLRQFSPTSIVNPYFSCNKGAIEGSRCFLMCEKGARLEVSDLPS